MKKLNMAKVLKSAEAGENAGFCVGCGAKAYGVEPDARKYACEKCGALKVYGAEELVLMVGA